MMLPVLSSEPFIYHYMQNPAVVRVHDTSDFAVVRALILLSMYSDDSKFFACYGIQMSRTTAQVAPFESPPPRYQNNTKTNSIRSNALKQSVVWATFSEGNFQSRTVFKALK